jgi:SNF2 family DNA or RNA helicase
MLFPLLPAPNLSLHSCPAFKLLTYYGSAKERKAKRQGWSKPNAFHVCITSYTLVLQVGSRGI